MLSISTEYKVARNTLWLHCIFPTMEVKPESKYFSKYLRFLSILFKILAFPVHGKNRNESIIILLQSDYVLPDCWLQRHNTSDKLLVSKTRSVLKQEWPNVSTDTSNILLVVYFTSDTDNKRAGLWMMKLTDSLQSLHVQRWSDDGKMNLLFRLRVRTHYGIHCQSYFATYCDIWIGNSDAISCT